MILHRNVFIFLFICIAKGDVPDADVDGYLLEQTDDRLYDDGSHLNYVMSGDNNSTRTTGWWKQLSTNSSMSTVKSEFKPIPDLKNITKDVAEQILSDPELFNYTVTVQIKLMYGEENPDKYNETSQQLFEYLSSIKFTTLSTSSILSTSTGTRKTIRPFTTEWPSETTEVTEVTEATEVVEETVEEEISPAFPTLTTVEPFPTTTMSVANLTTNNITTGSSPISTLTTDSDGKSNISIGRQLFYSSTREYDGSLIDGIIIRTTTTQHPIITEVLTTIDNRTSGHGPFTGFLVKLFEIIPKKSYTEQKQLTAALVKEYADEYEKGIHAYMGDTARVLMNLLSSIHHTPADVVRSQAIWAKEVLQDKDKHLANDTNYIFDRFNRWYTREQGRKLIRTLPLIYEYPNNKTVNAEALVAAVYLEFFMPYYKASYTRRWEMFQPVNDALMKRNIRPNRRFGNNVPRRHKRRKPRDNGDRARNVHDRSRNVNDRRKHVYDRERYYHGSENRGHRDDRGRNVGERGEVNDRDGSFHDRVRHVHDRSGQFEDKSRKLHHRKEHFHDRSRNIDGSSGNIDVSVKVHHKHDRKRKSHNRERHFQHRFDKIHDRIKKHDDSRQLRDTERLPDKSRHLGGVSQDKVRHFDHTGENNHDRYKSGEHFHHKVKDFDDKSRNIDDRSENFRDSSRNIDKHHDDERKLVKYDVKDDVTEVPVKIKFVVKNKKDDYDKDNHKRYEKYEKPIFKSTKKYPGLHIDTDKEYTSFSGSEYESSFESASHSH